MKKVCFILMAGVWFIGFLTGACPVARAASVINELLADPPPGAAGDANNDGVTSATQDEFVELFNNSQTPENISGWRLEDAVKVRHVFPENTVVSPFGAIVVFGGGIPQLSGINWQVASTGTLSLNNTGDTLGLFDHENRLADQVTYGSEGGADQSLVRSPEGTGTVYVGHLFLPDSNERRFSSGYLVHPPVPPISKPENAVVPEIATLYQLLLGIGAMLPFYRKTG